jgi:hypothetical protein
MGRVNFGELPEFYDPKHSGHCANKPEHLWERIDKKGRYVLHECHRCGEQMVLQYGTGWAPTTIIGVSVGEPYGWRSLQEFGVSFGLWGKGKKANKAS